MIGVSSYLIALQEIKGMTPDKKYKTILEHIKTHMNMESKKLNPEIWKETGEHLQPLYKLIIANMTENYDMITELLKSEDEFITCKALKCRWYFQGKNEDVINAEYFFQNIIPFVTLKTRHEIVKSLGRNLKNEKKAEDFFVMFVENYGVSYSIPLLFACSEDFVKANLFVHRIILSVNQVDRLYLRKPNVITYYFNLIKSRNNSRTSIISKETIHGYKKFLPKLIKRNHNLFNEIVTSWSLQNNFRSLDKKYAKNILKRRNNSQSILEENPRVWIKFIDLEMINETLMNTIFPALLPESVNKFQTNKAINYLEYYPKDKVYKLISESYEKAYGQKFIDNKNNITIKLLPFLPTNLRIKVLPFLRSQFVNNIYSCEENYDSYLPTSVNMKRIKAEIKKAEDYDYRVALIIKMIYNCKVNDDIDALCQFLEYVDKNHKNERLGFWQTFFTKFQFLYTFDDLEVKLWPAIDTLILSLCKNCMFHNINSYLDILQESILVKYKHFSMHDLAKEFTDMYLHFVRKHPSYNWSRYDGKPQDRNLFFKIMVDQVEKKFVKNKLEQDTDSSFVQEATSSTESTREINTDSDSSLKTSHILWNEEVRIYFVTDLVLTMYQLDKEYAPRTTKKKRKKKTTTARQRLICTPFKKWRSKWLLSQVEDLLTNKDKIPEKSMNYFNRLENAVKEKDPKLYEKLLNVTLPTVFNFKVSAPFKMLRTDPKQVLNKISYFLDTAEESKSYRSGRIKRFFTMCRWYNILPIKFIEEARIRLSLKNEPYYLYLMAIILDGQCFRDTYRQYLLEKEFYEYDISYHLNISEIVFNVCMKSSYKKVQDYLRTMSHKKIMLKKNAIRIYGFAETIEKRAEYLLSRWKNEKEHQSIRVVIFKSCNKLFANNPKNNTWSTFKYILETYQFQDWEYYKPEYIETHVIPIEYINDVVKTITLMTMKILDLEMPGNTELNDIQERALDFLHSTIYDKLSCYYVSNVDDKIILNFIEKYSFRNEFINDNRMLDIVINNYLFAKKEEYLARFKKLGKIMEGTCDEWFHFQLEHKIKFPIMEGVGGFIKRIQNILLDKSQSDSICPIIAGQIIDELVKTLYKVPIYIDIWSYIMLQLTKYYILTPLEFAENVSTKLIQKCKENKCSYVILAKAIGDFLLITNGNSEENIYYPFINELLKNDTCSLSKLTAVQLLPTHPKEIYYDMHFQLLDKFKALKDPEVFCLLYARLNGYC
ncbi:uncharacterized protein LOC122515283 isoform X2 [Polistes fuscatus]|uniref:uncharacterized protein LOC122515283 isoform X2 n=1 Tax=Polistes fuscatus TaxID=30207 RepID=UPI001CA93D08|nr:uncharacterized protein LOC122515283 isoform X2 [Polistes fuscatus]